MECKKNLRWVFYTLSKLIKSSITEDWVSDFTSPQIVTTGDTEYTIETDKKTLIICLVGDFTTVVLPIISDSIGLMLFIKNSGTNQSNVIGNPLDTVLEPIWEGGMSSDQSSVEVGVVMKILNDGNQWTII